MNSSIACGLFLFCFCVIRFVFFFLASFTFGSWGGAEVTEKGGVAVERSPEDPDNLSPRLGRDVGG